MDKEEMPQEDGKKGAEGVETPMGNKEKVVILEPDKNRIAALAWLRSVLASILEVAPLPQWQKKRASHLLHRLPDWIMARWATALDIDYVKYYQAHPDLAEKMSVPGGRKTVEQYIKAQRMVSLANILKRLVQNVLRQWKAGKLPIDNVIVEREVCALAFAGCTPAGTDFSEKASAILTSSKPKNHVLIDYKLALDGGRKWNLEEVDATLAGGRYGDWVAERIVELRRHLGLEVPLFRIQFGRRTHQWDFLWHDIMKGGVND